MGSPCSMDSRMRVTSLNQTAHAFIAVKDAFVETHNCAGNGRNKTFASRKSSVRRKTGIRIPPNSAVCAANGLASVRLSVIEEARDFRDTLEADRAKSARRCAFGRGWVSSDCDS